MNTVFAYFSLKSLKYELIIALSVVSLLFCLPIVVVASAVDLTSLDSGSGLYDGPIDTNNNYSFGYCTYWAALRRAQIGQAIPGSWGNANTWDDRAIADGYLVDGVPSLGAIMQTDAYTWGHVAFVESVDVGGGFTISEMNWVGWDRMNYRHISSSEVSKYSFIHGRR